MGFPAGAGFTEAKWRTMTTETPDRIAKALSYIPSNASPEHRAAAEAGKTDAFGNWKCAGCEYCKGCVDCVGCMHCKGCVGCVGCVGCEYCRYCKDCENCMYCKYCADCKDCRYCKDCTGRVSARH